MIELHLNPSKRELQWFGPLTALFVAFIGALLYLKIENAAWAWGVWGLGVLGTGIFYLVPPLRLPMYRCWMTAVFPLGWAISHVVLGIVYYLVITPIALIMRLGGRDALCRNLDRDAKTYWVERSPTIDRKRYFKQF